MRYLIVLLLFVTACAGDDHEGYGECAVVGPDVPVVSDYSIWKDGVRMEPKNGEIKVFVENVLEQSVVGEDSLTQMDGYKLVLEAMSNLSDTVTFLLTTNIDSASVFVKWCDRKP